MTYVSGGLIQRDDYNTFATGNADGTANHSVANINTVWGVGNGDKGYGQSTVLTAVNAGDLVTATQWSTMIARLNSILTHQAGSGSGITSPVSGDVIAILSTLSTNVTNAYNNRANFNSTRGTPSTTNYDATWNSASPTTFQQVRTVTFASADQARYFFNAGGRIGIALSVPAGGTDNSKESSWSSLLGTGIGTLSLDFTTSTRSGTGFTLTTNGSASGFWDLTGTDKTLIRLTDTTAAYTSNYVNIAAKISGATGSNGGLGSVITFTIDYNDGATDTFNDGINMTMRAAVVITPPETTNLTNTWGTVTPAATVN
jgi:hypothetical protein